MRPSHAFQDQGPCDGSNLIMRVWKDVVSHALRRTDGRYVDCLRCQCVSLRHKGCGWRLQAGHDGRDPDLVGRTRAERLLRHFTFRLNTENRSRGI